MRALADRVRAMWQALQRRGADMWSAEGSVRYAVRGLSALFAFIALFAGLSILLRHSRPPMGTFVYGGMLGLIYALIAFGLILIFRANRIINFAMAEMGAAPAVFAVMLIKHQHVPYVIALPIAVVTGVVAGALVELLIIRRFSNAPRLILSVATIGVSLIFAALQFYIPQWLGGKFLDEKPPSTPFTHININVGGMHSPKWLVSLLALRSNSFFNANYIVILVFGILVAIGLTLFFRLTDVGIAVRASAENRDRAALLGIPVRRVSTVVWMIAAGMASLGVFLRIPVIGLPVGVATGPEALVYALAAAVIARMESFTVALFAGIAIGILEQCLYFFSGDPALAAATMLPLLLIALLLQRRGTSRGRDTGVSTWQMAKEFRPIPPELRDLTSVQWTKVAIGAVIILAAVFVPFQLDVFRMNLASIVLIYALVAVSLVILTGWAGQISLGQWGFVGIGAAAAGSLATRLHADFFVCIVAAGVVGAIVSVIIGLPALRIQGLYLAVTTLAFAITVQHYFLSTKYFSRFLPTHRQTIERPLLYGRFNLESDRHYYWFVLVVLALALLSARALRRSRAGRVLIASRDNERGAQSYGINLAAARLTAFAMSGFWAAVGGALFAFHQGVVETQSFPASLSILCLIMVVIGGLTSLPGAILGALWIGVLRYGHFNQQVELLSSGLGVLVLLMFFPGGLAQIVYGARDAALRWLAERKGIRVPSLVADLREEQSPETEADMLTRAAESVEFGRQARVVLPDQHVTAVLCPQCGDRVELDALLEHPHFAPVLGTGNGAAEVELVREAVPVAVDTLEPVDVPQKPAPRLPRRRTQ